MEHYLTPEQKAFIEEALDNPAILKWLSQFRPDGVEPFLADYHDQRKHWLNTGDFFRKEQQGWLTIDMERAERVLFFIQQKKLFDLQCRWRAELVTVAGIRHSAEFDILEKRIHVLDILPPITPEELEILKAWVQDYSSSRQLYPEFGWQNYRSYTGRNGFGLPAFYEFADRENKVESLWKVLPDIRGEKELKYLRAVTAERYKDHKAQELLMEEPRDERERLYNSEEQFKTFSQLFESYHTNECREAYQNAGHLNEDYELKFAIETLENAREPVAMEAHKSWRQGIKRAAWKYERKRLLPCLDIAYENYRFRLQMGISLSPEKEPSPMDWMFDDPNRWGEEILDGRELLGEPRDFNF